MSSKKKIASKSPIRPLSDRVVLRPLTEDEIGSKAVSNIILPTSDKESKSDQGIVLAVGAGRLDDRGERIPLEVKVGDRVFFSKYSVEEVTINDEEYFLVGENGILGVFN